MGLHNPLPPLVTMLLVVITGCTPPKGTFNVVNRNLNDDPPVAVTAVNAGEFVEVIVRANALVPKEATVTKTSTVTIGAVLQLDTTQTCPDLPQSSLPAGITLESGSTLTKQFDLSVRPGERVSFGHTVRFTSSAPQQVAVLVAMWGKPSVPAFDGDPEREPVRVLACKPLTLGGSAPVIVTFR